MISRYSFIIQCLPELNYPDVNKLRIATAKDRAIGSFLEIIKKFESINKNTQADDTTLPDVHGLFNHVIDSFPVSAPRLKTDSNIVHSPNFESCLVKLQLRNKNGLTRSERVAFRKIQAHHSEEIS